MGVERTPHAFGHQHSFLQEKELGLYFHLELFRHLEQLREQPGNGNLVQGEAEDGFADGAASLGEVLP